MSRLRQKQRWGGSVGWGGGEAFEDMLWRGGGQEEGGVLIVFN